MKLNVARKIYKVNNHTKNDLENFNTYFLAKFEWFRRILIL